MTPHRALSSLSAGFLLVAALQGCYSADAHVAPEPEPSAAPSAPGFRVGDVTYSEHCVWRASDTCRDTCDDCWDLCVDAAVETGGSCAETCSDICDCPTGKDDVCLQSSYTFEVENVDQDVVNACEDMWSAYANGCGTELEPASRWCRHIARLSAPSAGEYFRSCAQSLASSDLCLAACSAPDVPFSAELCGDFEAQCGACPLTEAALIDNWAGLMRREVLDAARACVKLEKCSDAATCLLAWEDLLHFQ